MAAQCLLIIIYLAFISLGLPDSLLGAAWPVMRLDFHAPLETAGLLSMLITASTIASSLACGYMLRRFGTGKLTLISCILTAGALLGFSFAPSWGWIVLLAIPLGLGGGSVDAGLNHYVAAHYKAHHMSWLHCFWGVGATIGPIVMSRFIAESSSWRDGYLTISVLQFGLVVILFATLPLWGRASAGARESGNAHEPEGREGGVPEEESAAPSSPWRIRGVAFALASFLLYCGVEAGVGLWGSSYLVNVKALDASAAAQWISVYYAGITVGRFITGFITFKVSNRMLIRAGQVTALAGGALVVLPLPAEFTFAGLIVTGLGLAPIFPCMLHETPVRFGKKHAQTIIGWQIAVAYAGSTLVPPLLGFLASVASLAIFPAYLVILAAAMLLCTERLNAMLRLRGAVADIRVK
ncbi:MFS transporter [Cohnella caldifontis]|uniref:MFS transporter n=1 Tax=Cohnella caldifontis TaxID=3027471 RepID=UPI0023EDE6CC|nr:MFS transporter [Cohnella sp. YIM B05605]